MLTGAAKVSVALPTPGTALLSVGTPGGPAIPVPVSVIVCGLPTASLLIVRLPLRVPASVGVKLTFKLQLVPIPRLAPQLLVTAKLPLAVIPAILSTPPPLLVSVTVCVLLLPRFCEAKFSEFALSDTSGTVTAG